MFGLPEDIKATTAKVTTMYTEGYSGCGISISNGYYVCIELVKNGPVRLYKYNQHFDDVGKPYYFSRKQFNHLLRDEHLYEIPSVSYKNIKKMRKDPFAYVRPELIPVLHNAVKKGIRFLLGKYKVEDILSVCNSKNVNVGAAHKHSPTALEGVEKDHYWRTWHMFDHKDKSIEHGMLAKKGHGVPGAQEANAKRKILNHFWSKELRKLEELVGYYDK